MAPADKSEILAKISSLEGEVIARLDNLEQAISKREKKSGEEMRYMEAKIEDLDKTRERWIDKAWVPVRDEVKNNSFVIRVIGYVVGIVVLPAVGGLILELVLRLL